MIDLNNERHEFEALPQIQGILTGGNVYFSTLSMNYTSNKPDLEHCVYYINGAWYAWMEKATAQSVPALQQQIKVLTADLKESQSDFAYAYKSVTSWTERAYKQREKVEVIKNEVERFQQSGSPLDLNQFLSNLIQLATFKNDNEFTDHLLVSKKDIEDWYLDEDEGLWLDHDGIDGSLCDLTLGGIKPIKHKEYLISQSNTLYAARVWDGNDDHIAWKFFESEESALEAAKHCKQMYDTSESGAEQ